MRITNLKLATRSDGKDELSATVAVEKPRPRNYHIGFRGPSGCFGDAPLGDIFFAGFWIPAMFLQEPFEIEGEVSKELLDAAYEQLEPVFLRWFRHEMRAARLAGATVIDAPAVRAEGTGCMFSGGLDSLYSVGRNLEAITHLVHLQGFDIPWDRDDMAESALTRIEEGRRYFDRELVVLRSNLLEPIRDLAMRSTELGRARPGFLAEVYCGSMLVAFSLSLRGILGRMIVPATWSYDHTGPWGSHPLVEPAWTTSSLEVLLDGCEADRIDKAAWLLEHHPDVFRFLRVCPLNPAEGAVNCGRCGKCLATMMAMRLAGASDASFSSFAQPLDLERAKFHKYSREDRHVRDLLVKAKRAGNREITRVARILLGEEVYWPRIRHRLGRRFRQRLGGGADSDADSFSSYAAVREGREGSERSR